MTEKTDACMDNLQVGLELWEKQLVLGGEVDDWAGAKLTLFAESHPFHNEQQVLAMRVRFPYRVPVSGFGCSRLMEIRSAPSCHPYGRSSLLCRTRSRSTRRTSTTSTGSL